MSKDQLSLESSGQTHNSTQVKTLFVHTRIKLCNRKPKLVGGWSRQHLIHMWPSGRVEPTSQLFSSNAMSSFSSISYSYQDPGLANTSTQVLWTLLPHSCYIPVPTHLNVHSSVCWTLTTSLWGRTIVSSLVRWRTVKALLEEVTIGRSSGLFLTHSLHHCTVSYRSLLVFLLPPQDHEF